MRSMVGLLVLVSTGCPIDRPEPPHAPVSGPIVTAERSGAGGHLVLIDEAGVRVADLTKDPGTIVLDSNPSWSPDGKWVVFASTRGRADEGTSLWAVRGQSGSTPLRLTNNAASDRDPVLSPNGKWLVFASNRAGSKEAPDGTPSFDLWKLAVRVDDKRIVPSGRPKPITRAATHELSPAFFPDGRSVVYMTVSPTTGRSRLWSINLATGERAKLTEGPADYTPAVSPDGNTIAVAGAVKGRDDTDMFLIDADGHNRRLLVDEPLSDQSGPKWSQDGRHLFATSLYRSSDGRPILSSVVVVDMRAKARMWRALHDPSFVESRVGSAVAPGPLDAKALSQNPPYKEALQRAVVQSLRAR